METAVHLEGISKTYGGKQAVLSDVCYALRSGSILSVVGRSGCGKSTLLNIIAGLDPDFSGSSHTSGGVSYVTQGDELLPWRTTLENVLLPAEIAHSLDANVVKTAGRYLLEVGLGDSIEKFPHELSGGMRQRVVLARALLENRSVCLFDEPFTALDFDIRLRLGRKLRSHIKRNGQSAIFVTHHIEEAISLGDRLIVLGGSPSKICMDRSIELDDNFRNPIELHRTAEYQKLFSDIWEALEEK